MKNKILLSAIILLNIGCCTEKSVESFYKPKIEFIDGQKYITRVTMFAPDTLLADRFPKNEKEFNVLKKKGYTAGIISYPQ